MRHFINLKDIPAKDLRKIIVDAKKRKVLRRNLNNLDLDKGAPLKGKLYKFFLKSKWKVNIIYSSRYKKNFSKTSKYEDR